jgi:hypothetical protein
MAQPGDVTWIRIDLNQGDMLREARRNIATA